MAEERARLTKPGQARELVDRRYQERRQASIDRFVHGQHRQRPVAGEIASRIGAADHHVLRRSVAGHTGEGVAAEWRAAPRTSLDRRRRLTPLTTIAPHTRYGSVVSRVASRPSRLGEAADPTHKPISIGQSPSRRLPSRPAMPARRASAPAHRRRRRHATAGRASIAAGCNA